MLRQPFRVKQTTTTLGTGTLDLLAPSAAFRSFVTGVGNGNRCVYVLTDGTDYETGIGTVTSGTPDTLSRDTVLASSNGGAKVNWAAGTRDVFVTALPGRQAVRTLTDTGALSALDAGALHLLNAATAKTLNLEAVATVGPDFAFEVENIGAGTWTLDPNSTEQIDGGSTFALAAGESALVVCDGSAWIVARAIAVPATPGLPRGYLAGLGLSNNGSDANNDIDIAAGECRGAAHTDNLVLAAPLTKRLDASWAVGTNQGGLDTGSKANSTWYHLWLIKRSDTGVVDALFSTSASSPTMPASYDLKRRIGSVRTDGSGNLLAFSQWGDHFLWSTIVEDQDGTIGGTASDITLSVPTGVKVEAFGTAYLTTSGGGMAMLSAKDQSDAAPSLSAAPGVLLASDGSGANQAASWRLRTNTSAQIRARASGASTETVRIWTQGWVDRRGRDD